MCSILREDSVVAKDRLPRRAALPSSYLLVADQQPAAVGVQVVSTLLVRVVRLLSGSVTTFRWPDCSMRKFVLMSLELEDERVYRMLLSLEGVQ